MNVKKTIRQAVPLVKYVIFLHIALFGFPYLYVNALRCYVDRTCAILVFFVLCCALDHFVSGNRYLKRSGWGKSVSSVLIAELFCLILFAQYHFVLAVLLAAALLAFFVWFYKTVYASRPEKQKYRRYRMLCRHKAVSALCCAAAAVLVIPACIGAYREGEYAVSLEEWQVFVSLFNESADDEEGLSLFEKYSSSLDELENWERLSRKERLALLEKVGLIEEEYLGVESEIPIVISSIKMDKYTCAYYEDETKEIRINIEHIDNASLEENLTTILHEVFHSYQHYVCDRLDFDSDLVRNSYYYRDARAWHDNMDHYVSGYADFDAYEAQPLEADARAYSESRVLEYLSFAQQQP